MKNLFKNMLFLVFLLFFSFVFLKNNNVFASENLTFNDVEGNSHTLVLSDAFVSYPYRMITAFYANNMYSYNFYFNDKPFSANLTSCVVYGYTRSNELKFYSLYLGKGEVQNTNFSNITSNDVENYKNGVGGSTQFTLGRYEGAKDVMLYSSKDVYSFVYDKETDDFVHNDTVVVFQGAPQEEEQNQEQSQGTQLSMITKSIDFSTVLAEVLGILPMILLMVIGLLSLMKAIRVLLQMLQKA